MSMQKLSSNPYNRMFLIIQSFMVFGLLTGLAGVGQTQNTWQRDFDLQNPSKRPHLEARYDSSNRDGFRIEAERYCIQLDLKNRNRNAISCISAQGRQIFDSGYIEIVDSNGAVWNSLNTESPSRINLYRRGPYYNEIHWLDVSFTNQKNEILPIRGEVIFYSYAESCRIGIVLHATETNTIQQVSLKLKLNKYTDYLEIPFKENREKCVAYTGTNAPPLVWFSATVPQANFDTPVNDAAHISWKLGENASGLLLEPGKPYQVDAGFIVLEKRDHWDELRAELEPLDNGRLILREGLTFQYDPRRGDYVVSTHNPGGFTYHYNHPNDYPTAHICIRNDDIQRKIYLRHEIGSGSPGLVECGVVLNKDRELLPIPVQISKNFAGEKEEKFYNPTDIPFSETFFPLNLDSQEECELVSLQLYQNWGNHPLKQFSSLGAWMDYFHMSTGVTETTCYVPFKFYTGISIADLRGMSGRMWESQPQHDNVGGHIFMEYYPADRPGQKQTMEYLSTSYHSTGPDWAHITFSYLSSDERIKMELETFEYPQLDELRNFIRLRIKALADIPVDDWTKDFRIMQIDTHTQSLKYQKVTYIDSGEKTITKPVAFDDSWTLEGEAMSRKAPAAVLWNSPKGNNAFIVERWKGMIGGKPVKNMGVSCEGRKNKESNLVLVPVTDAKGFLKGDELNIDLFIMPFGKNGDDFTAAFQERERYGMNPVHFTCIQSGQIISHFPPRIRKTGKNLEFTIQGGYSTIALAIEGLSDYTGWSLEKKSDKKWTHLHHEDPNRSPEIMGEGQQRYVSDDGSYGVVFRIDLDGFPSQYRLVRESE